MKLTKARRKALEFVRDNQPVKLFPMSGPSLTLIKKLATEGLLAEERPQSFGFVRYSLSHAGLAALAHPAGRLALKEADRNE